MPYSKVFLSTLSTVLNAHKLYLHLPYIVNLVHWTRDSAYLTNLYLGTKGTGKWVDRWRGQRTKAIVYLKVNELQRLTIYLLHVYTCTQFPLTLNGLGGPLPPPRLQFCAILRHVIAIGNPNPLPKRQLPKSVLAAALGPPLQPAATQRA